MNATVTIEIPTYSVVDGLRPNWVNNFEIHVTVDDSGVRVLANKEGLESLANHLLNLAQSNVSAGTHLHLDQSNGLNDGSSDLILEKL